ncbi:hypothetical protein [Salinibaculum rarum]|uniref:hypothetical protein n=1 Tax=Salinibaculum rarum TaxID=3058903 RepID=UPI00265D7E7E|nr:hypothetical protein [Salinibaculum sp. KK48]
MATSDGEPATNHEHEFDIPERHQGKSLSDIPYLECTHPECDEIEEVKEPKYEGSPVSRPPQWDDDRSGWK